MSIRIGIGLDNFASAGIDADALAFFARVTAAGGTLSGTEKTAVNNLVLDMKAANIWTAMKAVYPMVGASAAACAQNLIGSGFTGTFNGGWTYASTGVTPNGTNAYMDTFFNPYNQFSGNLASLSYYGRTAIGTGSNNGNLIGTEVQGISTGNRFTIIEYLSGNYISCFGNAPLSELLVGSASITPAFFISSRQSTTNFFGLKNKTTLGTITTLDTTKLPSSNVYVGAINITRYSTNECAFAHIGNGLTISQSNTFCDVVQAFQTTLSRQV